MKVCRTRYCTMQLCCYASNDWEATRVEKGKLLKEIWSWNPKRGLHCPLTQLIKKKASASVCRRWIQTWLVGLVGAADQSESSGSHFKLRRLDECVWWRVCHSKGCRIKSQSDFPWEGLKITGDKKEKGANIRSSKINFFHSKIKIFLFECPPVWVYDIKLWRVGSSLIFFFVSKKVHNFW